MTSEIKLKWNESTNKLEVENLIKQDMDSSAIKYHYDAGKSQMEKLAKELDTIERIMAVKKLAEQFKDKPVSEFFRRLKTKDYIEIFKTVPDNLFQQPFEQLNAMADNYKRDIKDAKDKTERLEPFLEKIKDEKTSKYIG